LVRLLQDHGFAAQRVPLSGAARGRFGGDLSVLLLGVDRRVEVKARANGFAKLYGWLDGVELLVIKARSPGGAGCRRVTACRRDRRGGGTEAAMTRRLWLRAKNDSDT
jgi:Holliday junction resolvase